MLESAAQLPLYDAHNHLQDAWLAPHRERILADLATIPLAGAVVNGTSQDDWADVAALAREHRFVRPSYGLHPWNVGNASATWQEDLKRRLDADPTAAVGEIGVDRWILERARPDDPRLAGLRRASLDEQLEAFTWQLALAAAQNRLVTIHCIDAWGALLAALRSSPRPRRGFLLHAYGGSIDVAREMTALGGYFSFNGYFLGDRQAAKRAMFASLPLERILVETDAPAMPPPESFRPYSLPGFADGNPINHPANIGAVYEGAANVCATDSEEFRRRVAENFARLFG